MTWTLCTSGAAISKAGANANSTIIASGATLLNWATEVEGEICSLCRYDVVTNYGSLTNPGKTILGQLASSMIAQLIVGYDLAGYAGTREGETILDVNENIIDRTTKIVTDQTNKRFLGISS